MATFRDKDEFVRILSALWDDILAQQEIVAGLGGDELTVKFRYPDLATTLFIRLSAGTADYRWDLPADAPFDVEMILDAQTAHRFWMERLNVPMAIASRRIIAKGSLQKALKLLPALKPAFALYPPVLRRMGRGDLLESEAQPTGTASKGRRTGLFGRLLRRDSRSQSDARIDLDVIPAVPVVIGPPPPVVPVGRPEAAAVDDWRLYRTMLTIRRFEEHLAASFAAGDLPTEAIHLSIGQEAVAAGVCLHLRGDDYLNTTHRGHGHIIAKGADPAAMMAELYGRAAGLCGGKGGSMHVTDARLGILGANGIVGAGYLLAAGAGFAIRHRGEDDALSVVIAGDGSVNQGMFHEAMNLIGLLRLPVLVVVENNRYGEFTPVARHAAEPEIHRRAAAYRIDALRIDTTDARALYREMGQVIDRMRTDRQPRLVEVMTYRWHGHMEGDPELYRTAEEKAAFVAADPLAQLSAVLAAENSGELERLQNEVGAVITAAVGHAATAAAPAAERLTADIYAPDPAAVHQGDFTLVGDLTEMSVSQAINEALAEEIKRDPAVFLWGEDVTLGGYFNVTCGLRDTFGPQRIIDTPISENGFVGGAVGAALAGLRPVVEILFADFLTCCMDPIVNQAAKLRYMTGGQVTVPLTIRTPLGSGIGMAAQHSQAMEKYFFGVPGLFVVAPSDPFTCKGLLKAAIRSHNPVLFFEHKLLYPLAGRLPRGEFVLPLGKARIVRRGRDVTVVTFLLGVPVALEAARMLAAEGIEVEVVDLCTLYPMDTATIVASVQKTGRLVTVEEGTFTGSVGSEIVSRVVLAAWGALRSAPVKIAAPDCPIPYAKNLEGLLMPSAEKIAARIAALLS